MQACPVGVSILTRLVGLGVLIFLLIFFSPETSLQQEDMVSLVNKNVWGPSEGHK